MISDVQTRVQFLSTLDWLRHVLMRYTDNFSFALVKIAYGDDNALGDAYGALEALSHLSLLTESLQNGFRKSDLVTRDVTDFWIIFPYTPFNENIYDKLVAVLNETDHEALNIVEREIAIFELPLLVKKQSLQEVDSGLALLHFLKAHQTELASHVFKLKALK